MLIVLFMRYLIMIKKEKWEEKIIKGVEIPPKKDVELIKTQPRYLGKRTNNPKNANLWDSYWTWTNLKYFTEDWRVIV